MCRLLLAVLAGLHLLAAALLAIGTFGLFGQPQDPLAGVFLLPLGLPWNRMLAAWPEDARPWLLALCPLINLLLAAVLCRAATSAAAGRQARERH